MTLSYDWYNARCLTRVYKAPGGVCAAPVRAVVGKRDGGEARVGTDPYLYECALYDDIGRLHVHQGIAAWRDPKLRDLGRGEERHRVRPEVERVHLRRLLPSTAAIQTRLLP